ncbi:SoxR reducing system RseC family protein [Chitinolyticbacter albus]|uniref:SoxR reducing system RseC family protein n=1 Tax=Chitinolyticbacter albus TaxID=2961951 RepID=UPI00210DA777|nr:SoxR reducing system RseC family protein [Chitinolyticbacter albus]
MTGWIVTEAKVQAREGDTVLVALRPHSPCGHCEPQTGCRALALSRAFAHPQRLFRCHSSSACAGDAVRLAIPDGTLWRAAWWAYGVPTLALLLGAAAGEYLAPRAWQPWSAVSFALLALALASLGWRRRWPTARVLLADQAECQAASSP